MSRNLRGKPLLMTRYVVDSRGDRRLKGPDDGRVVSGSSTRSEVGGCWSEVAGRCSTEDAVCVFSLMMWGIRSCGQRPVQPSRKRMTRVSSQRTEVCRCAWVGGMISAVGDDSKDGAPIPNARSSSCSSNARDGAGTCAFGRGGRRRNCPCAAPQVYATEATWTCAISTSTSEHQANIDLLTGAAPKPHIFPLPLRCAIAQEGGV